ncbi:MAG: hypothetical protein WKG07_39150 [Hymenobacter sp.]
MQHDGENSQKQRKNKLAGKVKREHHQASPKSSTNAALHVKRKRKLGGLLGGGGQGRHGGEWDRPGGRPGEATRQPPARQGNFLLPWKPAAAGTWKRSCLNEDLPRRAPQPCGRRALLKAHPKPLAAAAARVTIRPLPRPEALFTHDFDHRLRRPYPRRRPPAPVQGPGRARRHQLADWEYRYYSYNPSWGEDEQLAPKCATGRATDLRCANKAEGCVINGYLHEYDQPAKARMTRGLPAAFGDFMFGEPVASISTTFCLWYTPAHGWQRGVVENEDDGSEELLYIFDNQPATYAEWATEYYTDESDKKARDARRRGAPSTATSPPPKPPCWPWSMKSKTGCRWPPTCRKSATPTASIDYVR